jgi:hypothetical protein
MRIRDLEIEAYLDFGAWDLGFPGGAPCRLDLERRFPNRPRFRRFAPVLGICYRE